MRERQGLEPDATFMAQRGIYRYRSGEVVKEDGELYKNQFRIQIASYKTGRVKLIK